MEKKVRVCDVCDKRLAEYSCYFCGMDIYVIMMLLNMLLVLVVMVEILIES